MRFQFHKYGASSDKVKLWWARSLDLCLPYGCFSSLESTQEEKKQLYYSRACLPSPLTSLWKGFCDGVSKQGFIALTGWRFCDDRAFMLTVGLTRSSFNRLCAKEEVLLAPLRFLDPCSGLALGGRLQHPPQALLGPGLGLQACFSFSKAFPYGPTSETLSRTPYTFLHI